MPERGAGVLPALHGPLGLVLAPNGDLIVANGDAVSPGGTADDLVEFDRASSAGCLVPSHDR